VKLAPILFIFVALLTSCNKAPHSNAAIRQGVIDHLNKGSGLNLSTVDIDVTNVAYEGDNKAIATVFFRPKSSPEQGMTMNYTLETQGKKWVVVKRPGLAGAAGGSNPHGGMDTATPNPHGGGPPAGSLPPGHPSVSGEKGSTAPQNPGGAASTK
jgi:hypothetical protein